jgi:hypothetical protein
MLGATDTTSGPDVAPDGIVMIIDVAVQEFTVTGTSFKSTELLPCMPPNPEPEIATWVPTVPVVADTLLMMGPGEVLEVIDTLSNVAVVRLELLMLPANKPTWTFVVIVMVSGEPAACTQLTPSDERYAENVLPDRISSTQIGREGVLLVSLPVFPPVLERHVKFTALS